MLIVLDDECPMCPGLLKSRYHFSGIGLGYGIPSMRAACGERCLSGYRPDGRNLDGAQGFGLPGWPGGFDTRDQARVPMESPRDAERRVQDVQRLPGLRFDRYDCGIRPFTPPRCRSPLYDPCSTCDQEIRPAADIPITGGDGLVAAARCQPSRRRLPD